MSRCGRASGAVFSVGACALPLRWERFLRPRQGGLLFPGNCYWLNHRVGQAVIEIQEPAFSVTFDDLKLHTGGRELRWSRRCTGVILGLCAPRVSPQLTDV